MDLQTSNECHLFYARILVGRTGEPEASSKKGESVILLSRYCGSPSQNVVVQLTMRMALEMWFSGCCKRTPHLGAPRSTSRCQILDRSWESCVKLVCRIRLWKGGRPLDIG